MPLLMRSTSAGSLKLWEKRGTGMPRSRTSDSYGSGSQKSSYLTWNDVTTITDKPSHNSNNRNNHHNHSNNMMGRFGDPYNNLGTEALLTGHRHEQWNGENVGGGYHDHHETRGRYQHETPVRYRHETPTRRYQETPAWPTPPTYPPAYPPPAPAPSARKKKKQGSGKRLGFLSKKDSKRKGQSMPPPQLIQPKPFYGQQQQQPNIPNYTPKFEYGGIEAVLPPLHPPYGASKKGRSSAASISSKHSQKSWRRLVTPSKLQCKDTSYEDYHDIPIPVLTATSSSDDSPPERFDQSFHNPPVLMSQQLQEHRQRQQSWPQQQQQQQRQQQQGHYLQHSSSSPSPSLPSPSPPPYQQGHYLQHSASSPQPPPPPTPPPPPPEWDYAFNADVWNPPLSHSPPQHSPRQQPQQQQPRRSSKSRSSPPPQRQQSQQQQPRRTSNSKSSAPPALLQPKKKKNINSLILETSRVDTTYALSNDDNSSLDSSSSNRPDPVVIKKLRNHDHKDNDNNNTDGGKQKSKKPPSTWKNRLFPWKGRGKLKRSQSMDHNGGGRPFHRNHTNHSQDDSQSYSKTNRMFHSSTSKMDRSSNNNSHTDNDQDNSPAEWWAELDQSIWQTTTTPTGEQAVECEYREAGDQSMECEYRGNVGVQDWFEPSRNDDDDDDDDDDNSSGILASAVASVGDLHNHHHPGHIDSTTRTASSRSSQRFHSDTQSYNHQNPFNDSNINYASSLGEEEESLIDADDLANNTNSGVKELGQYAREMQSKASAKTPSPPSKPKRRNSTKKNKTTTSKSPSRLLSCALPGLGRSGRSSGSKRSFNSKSSRKGYKDDENYPANDFPDPEDDCPDYESDNNSYLAVSYTEEGAQLVVQQSSDELTEALERLNSRTSGRISPCDDEDDQEDEEEPPPVSPSLPDVSPQVFSGSEDDGYMNDAGGADDPSNSPFQPDAEDVIRDDLEFMAGHYGGLQRSRSRDSAPGSSMTGSSLGASFPHPAAQLRDNASQKQENTRSQINHPSASPPNVQHDEEKKHQDTLASLRKDLEKARQTAMRVRNSAASTQSTASSTADSKARPLSTTKSTLSADTETNTYVCGSYQSIQGIFPRSKDDPPALSMSAAEKAFPSIKTMRAKLQLGSNTSTDDSKQHPWMLSRRDDPPAVAEAQATRQRYRHYPTNSSLASCTKSASRMEGPPGSVVSRRENDDPTLETTASQTAKTTSSSSTAGSPTAKTTEGRSTRNWDSASVASAMTIRTQPPENQSWTKRYSLYERKPGIWEFYQPIQKVAQGVSQTLCENIYVREGHQPGTVPFDESRRDEADYRRYRRPPAPRQDAPAPRQTAPHQEAPVARKAASAPASRPPPSPRQQHQHQEEHLLQKKQLQDLFRRQYQHPSVVAERPLSETKGSYYKDHQVDPLLGRRSSTTDPLLGPSTTERPWSRDQGVTLEIGSHREDISELGASQDVPQNTGATKSDTRRQLV